MKDKLKNINHRHYISIFITFIFLGCGVIFLNAAPRLAEAFRDLFVSVGYYFTGIFGNGESNITPTVIGMPEWKIVPERFKMLSFLPWTFEEFKILWGTFVNLVFSKDNFTSFGLLIGEVLFYISRILVLVLPIYLLGILTLERYIEKHNNDYGKESAMLKRYKHFSFTVIEPITAWVRSFIDFLEAHKGYYRLWLTLWLFYFNIITVIVEFFAFYLYFVISFDFLSVYTQFRKLFIDLTPMLRVIPTTVWIVAAVLFFNYLCRKFAYARLYHKERRNRGFLSERGVVSVVYGAMGTGKTSLITSMALSAEAKFRDDAFEILLETDITFPAFPWCNLREEIKRQIEKRAVVDIPSCKRFIGRFKDYFEYVNSSDELKLWYERQKRKRGDTIPDFIFGYDSEHYPMNYNDELKITGLWEAIEDYVCAYFVYTVETSLIISNYAIRTDAVIQDLGNFPLWNSDFFRRDPKLMDAYSRHSHIIDFDMLRLGRRMLEDNPNRNAFGFGIYVISEIDKERKNALELKETKINTEVCNQKNDLFNACLKMSRHACVIANRVFIRIICDLQRPEDWGAGGREVGEVIYIANKSDMMPTLPFYSTFWMTESIFLRLKARYDNFYVRYIHNRADNTLFLQLLRNCISLLDRHYRRLNNLFGAQTLYLEVESGRMNGDAKKQKWFKMPKKDYSKRYSTNCLSAVFEGDVPNTVSINDFIEYANIMATTDELMMQHSHFQNDIRRIKSKDEAA